MDEATQREETKEVIVRTLKLKLTKGQEVDLSRWLVHLASIYNWGLRKIELNARDGGKTQYE